MAVEDWWADENFEPDEKTESSPTLPEPEWAKEKPESEEEEVEDEE